MNNVTKKGLQLAIIVFLIGALYTHLSLTANDLSRYALARSLALEGTAEISSSLVALTGNTQSIDRAEFNGRIYSDKGPLGGFLGAPFVFLTYHISGGNETLSIYCTSIALATLPVSLMGFFGYLLFRKYNIKSSHAAVLAFFLCMGTNLSIWSTMMFSHALTAALVFISFALLKIKEHDTISLFVAGLLSGLSVSSDYIAALFLPPIFFYCFYQTRLHSAWLVFGALIAGLFPAIYHTVLFGNPLSLPYEHLAVLQNQHDAGLMGATIPSPSILIRNLFSFNHGLFFYNPVLLLAFISGWSFYKKHKADAIFLGVSITIFLLFDSALKQHYAHAYGNTWGPRYLVPIIALMFIFLAGKGSSSKWVSTILISVGSVSTALNYYLVNLAFLPPPFTEFNAAFTHGPGLLGMYGGANIYSQSVLLNRALSDYRGEFTALDVLFRDVPEIIDSPDQWPLIGYLNDILSVPLIPSMAISIGILGAAAFLLYYLLVRPDIKRKST